MDYVDIFDLFIIGIQRLHVFNQSTSGFNTDVGGLLLSRMVKA